MTSIERWVVLSMVAGWLAAALSGCASSISKDTNRSLRDSGIGSSFVMIPSTAGYSIEDRPIEVLSFGNGSKCVLIIASIHGDEAAGTPLLESLATYLAQQDELIGPDQRVVLVPNVNPDGVAHHRRTNVQGVDLNRNFPASNFSSQRSNGTGPLSEPESRALHALIDEVRPMRVVSIHQPLDCLDFDGPARELAQAMAAVCDLPVRKLGARPGSLGSYVGLELGIPIVTVELPNNASRWSDSKLWDRYGDMLLAAIRF